MLDMILQTSKFFFIPKYEANGFSGKDFYIKMLLNHSLKGSEENLLGGVILSL